MECNGVSAGQKNDLNKKIENTGKCFDAKQRADSLFISYNSSKSANELYEALQEYENEYAVNQPNNMLKEHIDDCKKKIDNLPPTIVFLLGDTYKGPLNKKGQPHGKGIYTCANGNTVKYEGDFVNGKKHGEGTEYFRSGEIEKRTGPFSTGLAHGTFIVTFQNGKIRKTHLGIWTFCEINFKN